MAAGVKVIIFLSEPEPIEPLPVAISLRYTEAVTLLIGLSAIATNTSCCNGIARLEFYNSYKNIKSFLNMPP